jgi:predicted phage tail protein
MTLPIKSRGVHFPLLLGFVTIVLGAEIIASFIHFADWTYASALSLSSVVAITIGLPLILTGLMSVWAAVGSAARHWRDRPRGLANTPAPGKGY